MKSILSGILLLGVSLLPLVGNVSEASSSQWLTVSVPRDQGVKNDDEKAPESCKEMKIPFIQPSISSTSIYGEHLEV